MSVVTKDNPGQSPFAKGNPKLQIAWDSTSLGLLKTCPRKYQLKMLEHWAPRGERIHLDFGIMYHSALEEFDKAKAQGATHEDATHAAIRRAMLDSKNFIGTAGKDREAAPKGNIKSRETLIRAIVWYLEHFRDDHAKTLILDNGKPAVELSFKMELPFSTTDGEPFIACGHLDRVVEMGEEIYVLDRKTTGSTISSYYYNQFNPNNQISLYTLASKIILPKVAAGVIIDACQLAVGFARFHRGITLRTPGQLDEWLQDFGNWLARAEAFAAQGYWPMNDTACGNYGGCEFQEVCKNDPAIRPMLLKSAFDEVIWNPLASR